MGEKGLVGNVSWSQENPQDAFTMPGIRYSAMVLTGPSIVESNFSYQEHNMTMESLMVIHFDVICI